MIKQAAIGLNSRSEANPFDENGFLPLITAPMYSVVNHNNANIFKEHKINVCLPRGEFDFMKDEDWCAASLSEFNTISEWKNKDMYPKHIPIKLCIDTANGNIPELHDAIRKAKEIHGDNLVIMAGNVASVDAFVELAKTGVDYIRVGIGGGGGCNTTNNTGIGQENLKNLIQDCLYVREGIGVYIEGFDINIISNFSYTEIQNLQRVKIVADGISSWVKFCKKEYGYNGNGYAAINELLFAGADLVMVGKLFAQCVESAGEKEVFHSTYGFFRNLEELNEDIGADVGDNSIKSWTHFWEHPKDNGLSEYELQVKYAGMSTHQEQEKYKPATDKDGNSIIKPSEGSVQWIPVRWTLDEWLNGSANQDEAPYLMGWINSIKSAMAYTGKTKL